MKKYTIEDLADIPVEVLMAWTAEFGIITIGSSGYDNAIEKYPEYFPKEVARRKRAASIPKTVHVEYRDEVERALIKFEAQHPRIIERGLMNYCNATVEQQNLQSKRDAKFTKISDDLWKKFYSKYNI